jgi:AraC-like DNA-binding protein/mannose-6-phosphate isomerase-like protein (cupin superfamily)
VKHANVNLCGVAASGPLCGKPYNDAAWLTNKSYKDEFRVLEPEVSSDEVHVGPFDPAFPIEVRFLDSASRHSVCMNRHDCFEVLYLRSGMADLQIQNRSLPFREGELAVIGSTLSHSVICRKGPPLTLAILFFHPDLIRADGGADSAEYLTPFLLQNAQFPHIIPGRTGIPTQVFSLIQQIRTELPALSARTRLSVKTHLKMALMLLVNHYSSFADTVETFQRQQCALERLCPLFDHLEHHYDEPIQVQEAARICRMSESHFMSFFKRVTGQSFMVYLNHCRIERARELLISTGNSVSDISHEMGFCDQSYFGTVFRRLFGMSPTAYRRQYQNAAPVPLPSVDYRTAAAF